MPNRKLNYVVDVDSSDAVRGLRDVGDAGARAGRELADAFDDAETAGTKALAALSTKMDQLEADVDGTARAVQAIGRAAGDGFDSSRIEGFVGDLRRMGVGFDELEGKADEFAAALRRADGIKLSATEQGLTRVAGGLDDVTNSGDQSRSVLANMAGNTAQDLGEVGGVVGTLGVGLGQLAEYATEGNIALADLAKVAGPMAGLAAAGLIVNKVMGDMAKVSESSASRLDVLTESAISGADAWAVFRQQVEETGELTFESDGLLGTNFGSKVQNVIPHLANLGLTLDDFQRIVKDAATEQGFRDLLDQWLEADSVSGQTANSLLQVLTAVDDYQASAESAAETAADVNAVLGDGTTEALNFADAVGRINFDPAASDALDDLIDDVKDGRVDMANFEQVVANLADAWGITTQEVRDYVLAGADEQMTAEADAAQAARDALAGAADAVADYAAELDPAAVRAEAFADGLDAINRSSELGTSQRIIAASDAATTFGEALRAAADAGVDLSTTDLVPDTWDEVRAMSDEARGVVDAFAGMRDQIQSELAHAFETGGMPGLDRALTDIRQTVIEEMQAAGVEGTDALDAAFAALGIDRETIDILIRTTGDAQARAAIEGLQGVVDDLVAAGVIDTQVAVNIATLALTDPQAALAQLEAALEGTGLEVTLPAELDTTDADREMRGFTSRTRTATVDAEAGPSVATTGDELDDVAADRTSTINTSFVQQLVQGLILGAYLDYVARPRTVSIGVEVTGLAAANTLIDHAARDRRSTIVVDADTYGMQRAIATAISNAIRMGRVMQ